MSFQAPKRGIDAIDLLKAYAILGVLWQHTMPGSLTDGALGNLWVRPAVPIFFVLIGLNLSGSMRRHGGVRFDRAFLRTYAWRRWDRIAVPFLLVLLIGYVIAAAEGTLHLEQAFFIGGMPVDAPGNYFLPALIGLLIVLPLLVWANQRRPVATLLTCVALNVAFEAVAWEGRRHGVDLLATSSLFYQGNPLRWLVLVALGVWAADDAELASRHNRWLVVVAPLSVAYLVALQLHPSAFPFPPHNFLGETNLLAAPWAYLLILVGLRVLPRDASGRAPGRSLVLLGRASYHIYLVQMLILGVLVDHVWSGLTTTGARVAVAPLDALVAIAVGLAYYRMLPSGSALPIPRHRRRRAPTREEQVETTTV